MSNPHLISLMQQQERSEAYRCSDYLAFANSMHPDDRQALCNWSYHTVASCKGVSSATAVMAISYFDRFMSSNSSSAELALEDIGVGQLACVTCLVVALKVHYGFNVETDFVSNAICRDMYSADEINRMEIEILQSLDWRLNGPIPHDFIDAYLNLHEVIPTIDSSYLDSLARCSKAMAELAVTRYEVALHYPSAIAFTSICCALLYLEAVPSVDSVTVLGCIKRVSGLDLNDHTTTRLFKTMIGLMQEFSSGGSSRGSGGVVRMI
jgi:hypothetical protein